MKLPPLCRDPLTYFTQREHGIRKVVKYLPLTDLFRFRRITRKLRAGIDSFLHSLKLVRLDLSLEYVETLSKKIAEKCPSVEEIWFDSSEPLKHSLLQVSEAALLLDLFSHQLRKVEGLPCHVIEHCKKPFQRLEELCVTASLRDISLMAGEINGPAPMAFLKRLVLTFIRDENSSLEYPQKISSMIGVCPSLTKLVLASYGEIRPAHSLDSLRRLKSLRILGVIGFDMDDQDMGAISRCEAIKVLSIGLTGRVTEEGWGSVE